MPNQIILAFDLGTLKFQPLDQMIVFFFSFFLF